MNFAQEQVFVGNLIVKNSQIHNLLTTRNSSLSTRWLPSVSNILKAILNPECGSRNKIFLGIIIQNSSRQSVLETSMKYPFWKYLLNYFFYQTSRNRFNFRIFCKIYKVESELRNKKRVLEKRYTHGHGGWLN